MIRDILSVWKRFFDDGVWRVAEHGVEDGMEWFGDIGPSLGGKKLDDGREISLTRRWTGSMLQTSKGTNLD